ncbi:unnamed protein product [Miscanthus lutarioriparius]|uniref:Gnk2-homologous domain-containing protein n=1 Tax=Miscanthus lutarioriparius TaxID=422564 RepID=A0A811RZL4_9POAL|nr:unnamed protein product [Miscanthus lutarioriparius]
MSTRWPKPLCLPPQIAGVALTFLVAVLHTPFTFAQEQPPPWLICGPDPPSGNYTENSTCQGNINRLSGTLPKNVSSSPLRFSNRNFFPDTDNFTTAYYLVGSQVVSKPTDAFDAAVRLLVNTTAGYAAENSSRRFATGAEGFDGSNPRIYALAQCTPDKTVDFCQSCFGTIINRMPEDFSGVNGGGVFGTWCSFRYEVYPFFSGRPLLQLLVVVIHGNDLAYPIRNHEQQTRCD